MLLLEEIKIIMNRSIRITLLHENKKKRQREREREGERHRNGGSLRASM